MKTSRKIFCWIIVFAVFLTILAPVFAATDYGVDWELSDEGVLTVTYNGRLKQKPWQDQAEKVKKVVINEGLTEILPHVFTDCVNLEAVVLPESLKAIHDSAFPNSPYFTEIYIPAGVERIWGSAFLPCTALERIDVSPENPYFTSDSFGVLYTKDMTFLMIAPNAIAGSYAIPNTVTRIGGTYRLPVPGENEFISTQFALDYDGFYQCKGLTEIIIPDSVEHIGSSAFTGCYGLTEVTIPDSVRTLGDGAFGGCINLTKVHIGSGVKSIGGSCFSNCYALPEITIPSNVFEIGQKAFNGCKGLEKVVIEDGIQKIGNSAFLFCDNLKELRLPSTLTKISDDMVRNCINLKSVTIPKNVTHIGAHAFDGCKVLRDITFEGEAPTFGEVAFIEKGLYFHYPEGVESWEAIVGTKPGIYASIKWVSYTPNTEATPELPPHSLSWYRYENPVEDIYVEWDLTSEGVLTFRENRIRYDGPRDSVKKIVIGDGIAVVGGLSDMPLLEEVVLSGDIRSLHTFDDCPNLEHIQLPEGVRFLGGFSNNEKLTEIQIPKSVVHIASGTFDGCVNLERITVHPENRSYASDEYGVVFKKDMTLLLFAPQGISGSYRIPEGVTSIGGAVDYRYLPDKDPLGEPSTYYGFRNCGKLTEVVLSEDVTTIGESAFENCASLQSVSLNQSVTAFGNSAFRNCDGLAEIPMSPYVQMIGANTFRECDGLKEVLIPGTVKSMGEFVFADCTGMTKLVLEDGISSIGMTAFENCVNLQEVRLPNTITYVQYRFNGCTALESLRFPETVFAVDDLMFLGCDNLKALYFEGNALALTNMRLPENDFTIYYPAGNETWDEVVSTNAWRDVPLNWVPFEYHNWVEATCDSAKVCADCGKVSGEPLGHDWQEATCLTAKTCGRCGLIEGEALGHSWVEAGCTAPKTCHRCGLTEGEAVGHNFVEEICTRCGRPDIPGILGDVDGNGKLSYNDALLVLRASIKLVDFTAEQKLLGDFDGNGILNYNDALAILRASIGL